VSRLAGAPTTNTTPKAEHQMTRRRSIREQKGQTMVEFALVMPVLFLVLFGIIQFGALYNDYITVTDAARIGARKAAVSRQTGNPVGLATTATKNAASDLDDLTKLGVSVTATAWVPGADVTVQTSYPYSINILGMVVASGNLKSSTTERIE
jgi:Flp pilus assembly protein TadG